MEIIALFPSQLWIRCVDQVSGKFNTGPHKHAKTDPAIEALEMSNACWTSKDMRMYFQQQHIHTFQHTNSHYLGMHNAVMC